MDRSFEREEKTCIQDNEIDLMVYNFCCAQTDPNQAADVVRSGLSHRNSGLDASRLHLMMAELDAEASKWQDVTASCHKAAALASEVEGSTSKEVLEIGQVELAASMMAIRACLSINKDAEALRLAQQCVEISRKSFSSTTSEDKRWQARTLANGMAALVQHAACEPDAAADSFDNMMQIVNEPAEWPIKPPESLIAPALKQIAAFKLAQGSDDEAKSFASRSSNAAEIAAEEVMSEPSNPLAAPNIVGEALVDSYLQQGQIYADLKEWDEAERHFEKALESAEALTTGSSSTHLRLAFALLPLAGVYSRTGRVTLAEGLYREVIKLLQLNPEAVKFDNELYHPSIGAYTAWKYAQLLHALPKRSTEMETWHKVAADLYDDAPLRRILEPDAVFGTLDNLQGKGRDGVGAVIDLMSRRALPRWNGLSGTNGAS